MEDLKGSEIFLNQRAAEELNADAGDHVQMFLRDGPVGLRVKDVIQHKGLDGEDQLMLISLARAQEVFGKSGEINTILVSNRGDSRAGAQLSDEVTERLRTLLTDGAVAQELKDVLNTPAILAAIRGRAERQREALEEDLLEVADLLGRPEVDERLVSLLADDDVASQVQRAVDGVADEDASAEVFSRFNRLKKLNVRDVKRDGLDIANEAAGGITSVFVIMGLFSMMAGVMLIFLVFIMLAAERRPEMGIARAMA